MIRENQKIINRFQIVIDLVIVVIALSLAYHVRFFNYLGDYLTFPYYIKTLYLLIPLYFLLYNFIGIYEPQRRRRIIKETGNILKANIIAMTILLSALFFIKEVHYSRQVFFYFIVINCSMMIMVRMAVRKALHHIREKGFNQKFLLIIGAGRLAQKFIKKVKDNPSLGYEVIGILDDQVSVGKVIDGIKVMATISELEEVLKNHFIDEIIIALPLKEYDKLRLIFKKSEKSGVRTNIIPDYTRYIPARPVYDEIDGVPLINIRYIPLDNIFNALLKRLFDIVASIIGLLICLPIFLITAITIKIDSPGPILFKQERVGMNNKVFMMYKFRSMRMQTEDASDTVWTTEKDLRKTKIGSFIRKTSIDELPQLINVFKGDMSLVGPRPERPYFVNRFREKIPKYMIKHQVRPGITGWAQVNGWRGDTSIRKRIEHDLYYIENWTLSLDIKIMVLTIFKGFVNKNAY